MTDLSHQPSFATRKEAVGRPWPLLPYVCVFAAGGLGLLAGQRMGDAGAFESTLLLLLRFMAAMKFIGVLAAAGALHWRLTLSIRNGLAVAYMAALATMAVAPGLIWSLGGIALGALLFHAGLLGFLYLAWKDDGYSVPSRR